MTFKGLKIFVSKFTDRVAGRLLFLTMWASQKIFESPLAIDDPRKKESQTVGMDAADKMHSLFVTKSWK